MRKKIYSLFIVIMFTTLIILFFSFSKIVSNAIIFSTELFLKNIFPSLFPMFLISSMLISIGFPEFLALVTKNIMTKIFKTKGEASFVFFMSMLTGFPSSAKYTNDLLEKKLITKKEATKILSFTFFSNPLFIINTVGVMFLNNKKIGFLILLSHAIGNIIIGFIFRNFNKSTNINNHLDTKKALKNFNNKINNTSLFNTLLNAIKDSIKTLTIVFGTITCFLIITSLVNHIFNLNSYTNVIITSILEVTSGLKAISMLKESTYLKALLSVFFISFGGLSVHAQIMNLLLDKDIPYLPFLFARIMHAFISTFILYLLL